MLEGRELRVHERRREQLLARSAEDRLRLREQAEALRPAVAWVDLGVSVARRVKGCWTMAGPLLAAWRAFRPGDAGWMGRWARGVALARSLRDLWRTRRG